MPMFLRNKFIAETFPSPDEKEKNAKCDWWKKTTENKQTLMWVKVMKGRECEFCAAIDFHLSLEY